MKKYVKEIRAMLDEARNGMNVFSAEVHDCRQALEKKEQSGLNCYNEQIDLEAAEVKLENVKQIVFHLRSAIIQIENGMAYNMVKK